MIEQIALEIDAAAGSHVFRRIPFPEVLGPVDYAVDRCEKGDCLVFGKGLFAGSILPGSNRLIVAGRSPLWRGFYLSTMGGAALVFDRLGIEFVTIDKRAPELSVLILRRKAGEMEVRLEPIAARTIWEAGYRGEMGFYALQQAIFDRYGDSFEECRILATGPAALATNMGAIGSAPIRKGEITPVDTWAGRGGLGSKLVRDHGIVGIIYGGDYDEPDNWRDRSAVDGEFIQRYDRTLIKKDREATTKYRFDPAVSSGGTFGVNYATIQDWMLSFNYRSIYMTDEERLALWDRLVNNHYLRQFNEETIIPKHFQNCGEPCPAVCKKMRDIYKKDYEPYQALGPLIGVFDQRVAERVNRHSDGLGFDAIQSGGTVAWIMELLDRGDLAPDAFGFSSRPKFSPVGFDPVADSEHNGDLAIEILNFMVSEAAEKIREGIRNGARWLGRESVHATVYVGFGQEGCVVPNQYWAPGLFASMPIMGKYFQFYGNNYMPPYELGVKSARRMVKELYSDNFGMCRFHRGWVEEILPDLVKKHFRIDIDFEGRHRALARKIQEKNEPVFWESERVVDLVHAYLDKVKSDHESLPVWREKFKADKWVAAREYWEEVRKGIEDGFSDEG